MDTRMFAVTVRGQTESQRILIPCDAETLSIRLEKMGLKDDLRLIGNPVVNRIEIMNRHGEYLAPLIKDYTTLRDLNRTCMAIYRAPWQVEGQVRSKLKNNAYRSLWEVGEECRRRTRQRENGIH